MPSPLEANFLVPNGTFLVALLALLVLLVVLGLVVGGLLWLVLGRRGAAGRRSPHGPEALDPRNAQSSQ